MSDQPIEVKFESQEPVYENLNEPKSDTPLVEPKDDKPYDLPEMKGIVFGEMLTQDDIIVSLTSRGTTLTNAVEGFEVGVSRAKKLGWKPSTSKKSSYQSTGQSTQSGSKDEKAVEGEIKEFIARQMEVEPQAKGTTKVMFKMRYPPSASHPEGMLQNYPELTCSQKPENIVKYFKDCGFADFSNPETFKKPKIWTINYKVQWKLGRPNSEGKAYKDLVAVLPVKSAAKN